MYVATRGIVTKYLPATTYRGARIKASVGDHSITVSYYSLADQCNHESERHAMVAQMLCERLKWGLLESGCALPEKGCNAWQYAFKTVDPWKAIPVL